MTNIENRPQFFTCHNGDKAPLPFSATGYDRRLDTGHAIMAPRDIPAFPISVAVTVAGGLMAVLFPQNRKNDADNITGFPFGPDANIVEANAET